MTSSARISERVEEQGVLVVECSIPEDMTIAEWRALRPRAGRRGSRRRRAATPDAARHLAAVPDATCDHLHDTTSRYDRDEKQLTFLLVCRVCDTEKVVETMAYEPRFEPLGGQATAQAA
jgi:hypothetical protein